MKKEKSENFIAIVAVGILILFFIAGIGIYQETFMLWYWLLIPIILGPVLLYPFLKPLFLKYGETLKGARIMTVIITTPICFYLFLALNFYCIDNQSCTNKTFSIIEKGMTQRKNAPFSSYISINFNENEKLLTFSKNEYHKIMKSSTVNIKYCKGFLGFYVVKDYEFK